MLHFLGMHTLGKNASGHPKKSYDKIAASDACQTITHHTKDFLSLDDIASDLVRIKKRIMASTQYNQEDQNELCNLLESLSSFEFGRFLIANNGALSGGWTYYAVTGYTQKIITNETEHFILTKAPSILAMRERFGIFQNLLRQYIKENYVVCSVPCGVMSDLTTLALAPSVSNVKFVGIDIDESALDLALEFADFFQSASNREYEFRQRSAWDLGIEEEFDIIVSNGLNLYESDDEKVIALYQQFFTALKPDGLLITSALSAPPHISSKKSEWKLENIDLQDLNRQKKIFGDILAASWQNYRTSDETVNQLICAGFKEVEIHWDSRGIFYTVLARK